MGLGAAVVVHESASDDAVAASVPINTVSETTFDRRFDWVLPPAIAAASPDERRRGRLTAFSSALGGTLMLVAGTTAQLLEIEHGAGVINLIFGALFFAHPFVFRFVRSVALYANCLIGLALTQQVVLVLISGGSDFVSYFGLPALSLCAMLLGGPASGLFFMFASAVASVALATVGPGIRAPDISHAEFSVLAMRGNLFLIFGITAFAALYDGVKNAAIGDAIDARRRAERSELTFARAFAANPESLIIAQADSGKIVDCNDTFLDALGASSKQDILDRPFHELCTGGDAFDAAAAQLSERRPIVPFEYRTSDTAGVERVFEAAMTTIEIDAAPCLLVLGTDATERLAAARKVRRLNADLERRVRERTAELESFSYSVSHDLRAPLRTMSGFADAIVEDEADTLSESSRAYLERIRAAAGRMDELIDALLTLSRISRQPLSLRDIDLTALAEEIAAELRGHEPDRRVNFEVDPDLVQRVDPGLARIILSNLIGNAWKFSRDVDPALITFRAIEIEREDHTGYAVCDNGVGFAPGDAGSLFRPFQRLHDPEAFEGTGIGLATVQRAVSRHGGTVWASPGEDGGARFYFSLPTEPAGDLPEAA